MTRTELLERICPTAETYSCNIDNVGDCTYCNEFMNRFLDEYENKIRADAIEEFVKMLDEDIAKYEYSSLGLAMPRIRKMAEYLKEQK